jgi:hypothetical protein
MASIVPPTLPGTSRFLSWKTHIQGGCTLIFPKRRVPAKVPGVSLFYLLLYFIIFFHGVSRHCYCLVSVFPIIPTSLVLCSINGL